MTDDRLPKTGAETPRTQTAKAPRRSSLSGKLLFALVFLAAGWALAVSQSPKLAPLLPAPIAVWITPQGAPGNASGGSETSGEETSAALAALANRLDAVETATADAASSADTALAAASGLSDRLSEIGDGDDMAAALESRIEGVETALRDLAVEVASLPRSATIPPGLSTRISELEATLAELGGAIDPGDLPDRVASLEAALAQQDGFIETARDEVADGKRAVIVATALAAIDRSMTLGAPFPEALAELEAAVGEPAPAPLPEAAEKGAPTREALKASFPDAAHHAISAALIEEAGGDETAMAGVIARIQARVTGLPDTAIKGDSAPAVLSRARYALLNGDIDSALAAIKALPASAQDAMADWVNGARLRSAADHALATWRAEIRATL